jgi:hypothetical protein
MMKRENKQGDKVNIIVIGLILVIILSINFISALSAKIGNGKVVLNAKVGDIIEKSVKVINSNNVSVLIELSGGGDLEDQFKFKENNFTVAPNEETDAGYSLRVTKEGRSDSQINVKFTPIGGKNGIVLPASIIIFAAKGNNTIGNYSGWNPISNNTNELNASGNRINPKKSVKINPVIIGLFITAVIFIILLALLSLHLKNKRAFFRKETSERNLFDKKVELKQRKREI